MEDQGTVRLARLIAQRGFCSRREAERWMEAGRISVNGKHITTPGFKVDPAKDEIRVDSELIPKPKRHMYLVLNKPVGVLSSFTKSMEKGLTLEAVMGKDRRLFTAGRLDRDSQGMLILTTDGDWANKVMHPRYDKEKEYLVRFKKMRPTPAAKMLKEASYEESGREFRAKSVRPDGSYVRVILKEGRNREIRKLAQVAGLEVKELIRIRVGDVSMGDLKTGRYRKMSMPEVKSLDKD